ncbi:MAG: hypothetical protein J6U02_00285 [Elusimicrobia bacterium]|nr:hypothetical protein [Elusimicrobiota bacterium]
MNIKKILALEDFNTTFAKKLAADPKHLQRYEKLITDEFNKTGDISVFLEGLKVVAKAKGNIKGLAKNAKVTRKSIYNMLSKDSNPGIKSFFAIYKLLGGKVKFSFKKA